MAPGKPKKCKDAQHTSSITHRPQTVRGISYPPVHRESLVQPQHTIIIPRGYHSEQTMGAGSSRRGSVWGHEPVIRASQAASHNQEREENTFEDWLSPWCQEPPGGDAGTCCMGFWAPCVLYGKSDWRLKSLAYDENDSRRKWTAGKGCNGACWTYWGSSCAFSVCTAGILTGIQRTRVRGTYGIKGTVLQDGARGFFCPWCTQMQVDREIRAREGEKRFRYNKKYNPSIHAVTIDTQPPAPAPMTYAPSRQGSEHMIAMTQFTSKGKKLQKATPIIEKPTAGIQIEINVPKPTQSKGKASVKHAEEQQKEQKQEKTADKKKEKSKEKSAESASNQDERGTSKAGAKKDHRETRQLHTNAQSALSDAKASKKIGNNSNPSSSAAVDSVSAIRDKFDHAHLSQQHGLSDCVETREGDDGKHQLKQESHSVADCTTVESADTTQPPTAIEQHCLSDCSRASSREDVQELSYVHDFTDCPVDKAVLDYYENQSGKVQQHSLSDDPRASIATRVARNLHQHSLTDDSRMSISSAYGQKLQQHSLSNDPRASISIAHGQKVQQHSLSDDLPGSSSTIQQSQTTSDQHTEAECLDLNRAHSDKPAGRHNRSASYTTGTTVSKVTTGLREHRLASCPSGFSGDSSSDEAHGGHVHDENCLEDSLHQRCALNFEITSLSANENVASTSAGDAAKAKNGSRQKQRRSRGIRKTKDTKTSTGSNDNKSGQSVVKSAQIVQTNALSSRGQTKEYVQSAVGVVANELVGFPYSDFTETKTVVAGKTTVFTQSAVETRADSAEEQNTQDVTSSSFWKKITGSAKGDETSTECHV